MSGTYIALGIVAGVGGYFLLRQQSSAPISSGPSSIIGPGIASSNPIEVTAQLPDGRKVYCGQNVAPGYNTNILCVASDGEARLIRTMSQTHVNIQQYWNADGWSSYELAPAYSII